MGRESPSKIKKYKLGVIGKYIGKWANLVSLDFEAKDVVETFP